MQRKLRAHHLLCVPLFQGYGYSDAFCSNMEACIGKMCRDPQKIVLTASTDDIFAKCPNRSEKGECRPEGKDQEHKETVSGKDEMLLEALGLCAGSEYDFYELLACAGQKLTREAFLASCSTCRWYKQGLCSFENWQKGIRKLKNQ